ncbi:hypothetical protein LTR53_002962, partial [Teratosphaeriaceae sp. CCFEE 6253]
VLEQHDVLATSAKDLADLSPTQPASELEALIASLTPVRIDGKETWDFVDECMARASKQPVKYADQLEAATTWSTTTLTPGRPLPGLLVAVLAEQASFVKLKSYVMEWVDRFLAFVCCMGGPSTAALALREAVLKMDGRAKVEDQIDMKMLLNEVRVLEPQASGAPPDGIAEGPTLSFARPPTEPEDHPELLRWSQKDLSLALEDSDVSRLLLCLCSAHSDIRRQALAQLRILFTKLQASTLEDKGHLSVLIGEVIETFEQQCLDPVKENALPYLTATFAARALSVLAEPTHFLYPKLNHFIMRNPEWRIGRLPAYWLANTVFDQPTEDDAYWKEVLWVLGWLVDGVRTPADVDMLRRGEVFAKVMAVCTSPGSEKVRGLTEKVLELIWSTSWVEGGSDSLVARTSVLGWLDMLGGEKAAMVKQRLMDSCDKAKLARWSGLPLAVIAA